MARCGCTGSGICECTIQAGTGVSVTGTGSTLEPYEISANPAVGEIQVVNTATVNLTLTGDGSAPTPWEITASVIDEGIEDIIGGALGDGLTYDDAGNKIKALISGDANNSLSFGSDDGLFAAGSASSSSGPLTDYDNGFSEYVGPDYYTPAVFLESTADHVRLRGRVLTDGTFSAGDVVAVLPTFAWTNQDRIVQVSVPANNGTQVALDINTAGEIICQTAPAGFTSFSLDGLAYFNGAN